MSWWARTLDLLYPRICALCRAGAEEALCGGCASRIVWFAGEACPACGAEIRGRVCTACLGRELRFRRGLALGAYSGRLRDALLAFKFRSGRSLARIFARRMADRIRADSLSIDWVTFVPMSRWRVLAGRRYNPAELLADSLARELRRPCRASLRKIRRTRPQMELALARRLENPRGAYRARGPLSDRSVLLVDDVLTTGATASACSDALYAGGAREVSVAVIARSLTDGG